MWTRQGHRGVFTAIGVIWDLEEMQVLIGQIRVELETAFLTSPQGICSTAE